MGKKKLRIVLMPSITTVGTVGTVDSVATVASEKFLPKNLPKGELFLKK